MDKNELRAKAVEILNGEEDLKPEVAERVNQIVNDAIASMPPEKIAPAPKVPLAQKLKAQLDAAVASGSISEELAAKVGSIVTEVEQEDVPEPAAPAEWVQPAPPQG